MAIPLYAIPLCGYISVWLCFCVTIPVCGYTCVWLYLCVAIPVFGYTSVWLYLCVVIPVCGYTCARITAVIGEIDAGRALERGKCNRRGSFNYI